MIASPLIWIVSLLLLAVLTVLSVIDMRHYRLPNVWTYPLILSGLTYHYFSGNDVWPFVIGAGLGYGVFWLIEVIYKRLRGKPGLGRGDAKLLAAGGAWCGWASLPFIVFLGSGAALCWLIATGKFKDKNQRLAFGPFLAIGFAAVWLGQLYRVYCG